MNIVMTCIPAGLACCRVGSAIPLSEGDIRAAAHKEGFLQKRRGAAFPRHTTACLPGQAVFAVEVCSEQLF